MTEQRKPKRNSKDIDLQAAERFIQGVNSTVQSATSTKPKKVPIALHFDAELLTAIISYWCSRGVEQE